MSDADEARSVAVRPTRLWERWHRRGEDSCPFGVVLRPTEAADDTEPPFPTWSYRPSYLPPGMTIDVARDTPLHEPGLFYLRMAGGLARHGGEPAPHRVPMNEVTKVRISAPTSAPLSAAATAVQEAGVVSFGEGDSHLLELTFDGAGRAMSADLRPDPPLVLRW